MNELKFNSQVCTTKIQSQRLLELGLKPETADMYIFDNEVYIGKPNIDDIPAWSLHRLIAILNPAVVEFAFSTLEGAYEDVIYNISESVKNGHINKEYLKQ